MRVLRDQIGDCSYFGLLRGGRMTKFKGQTASIAPGMIAASAPTLPEELASDPLATLAAATRCLAARLDSTISLRTLSARSLIFGTVAAIPAALAGASALAGNCTEFPAASGVFTCSGPAGADVTQKTWHPRQAAPSTPRPSPGSASPQRRAMPSVW